jgi:hypothetical protein
MPLLQATDIQDALNIDLTDPEVQSLAESLIASATNLISTILGYPIEQQLVTDDTAGADRGLVVVHRLRPFPSVAFSAAVRLGRRVCRNKCDKDGDEDGKA